MPPPEPKIPAWRERYDEARSRAVFAPMPEGTRPHVVTMERVAATLDGVEVASAVGDVDAPLAVLARAIAVLLREHMNARLYEQNMHANLDCGPDRMDEILAALARIEAK